MSMLKIMKSVVEALKEQDKALKAAMTQEPVMYETIKARERQMAEADGIELTEDELESNVLRQMENNPYRLAVDESIEKVVRSLGGHG